MKTRRFYKVGMVIAVLAAISAFFLPESVEDYWRTLLLFGGAIIFVALLIALLVSKAKSKKQPTIEAGPTSIPTPAPAPRLSQAPAQASSLAQSAVPTKKDLKTERIHVRGISNYVENILSVATENPDYDLTKKELEEEHPEERVWQYEFHAKGALVPEPDNEYDPNAIMVQADGLCIGYVPKGSTAHVRKLMESGRVKSVWLNIGGGKYRGVYENDDGKYELDSGEKDFSAVVELVFTDD